jgi:hypothetical protein
MIWIMDTVLPCAEVVMQEKFRHIPKASLWFDDYLRTYGLRRYTEEHRRLQSEYSLKTYIWDGYWRKRFQDEFSIPCDPIHLAADEIEYFPSEPTHFKGFEESLIFVGNIPSLEFIWKQASAFPTACTQLIHRVHELMTTSAYGRLSYDILEEAQQNLPVKLKAIVEHFRADIAQNILINHLAWLLGKRETRLRILRLASQQRDVVILSGHSDKTFADAAELSKDIGQSAYPLKFVSTNHVKLQQLGCLYHTGGLHLQATDPQSVECGIPFRVFETAASGRVLLSDYKPGLVQCFKPDHEILIYKDDQDFPDQLSKALKNQKQWKEIGEAAYCRFLKEHTWKHRFETLRNRTQTASA